MAYIPEDQERDREELYGTPITALLEPVSCEVCKVLSNAITRASDLRRLQNLVATAQGHINRHHE